jgi:WD40 repeat protein
MYQVGGSLNSHNPTYVVRRADDELYDALKIGQFCYVLNSRQVGKSSLLARTKWRLEQAGYRCSAIDLSRIGSETITPEQWYKGVVSELWLEFGLIKYFNLKDWWSDEKELSILQRLSRFIDVLLLQFPTEPLCIFIDEIDNILSLRFSVDDFFALIRSCYNQRAINPEYTRITFALFGVATPSDLIQDKTRTPFNIGQAIHLQGFQFDEVQPLIKGLAAAISNPQIVLTEILNWTGGQPFLTQKLCQLALDRCNTTTSQFLTIPPGAEAFWVESLVRSRIIQTWEFQDEPEHLRTIRDRLLRNSQRAGRLLYMYQQILDSSLLSTAISVNGVANVRDNFERGDLCKIAPPVNTAISVGSSSEQIELLLSGLVETYQGELRVKNRIYLEVFNHAWIQDQLASLRPYSQALDAWIASNQTDESRLLRRQALQEALAWSQGKSLSSLDYQFLTASQEFDRREMQQSLEAERTQEVEARLREEQRRLAQEKQNVKLQRFLLGAVSLGLFITAGLGLSTFLAYHMATSYEQQAKVREIEAIAKSSETLLTSHRGLDALLEALRADYKLQQLEGTDAAIQMQVEQVLRRAAYGAIEYNRFTGHQASVLTVAIHPNGKIIASGSEDRTIKLWFEDGTLIKTLKGHNGKIYGVLFSPDGELIASASGDNTIKLWQRNGTLLRTLEGHQQSVYGVAFSPDGQQIASAGGDNTVKLWTLDGRLLQNFVGHKDEVFGVAFSPDGQLLASASADNTIKLWRQDGSLVQTLTGHSDWVHGVAFSPDGRLIASASRDQTIKLWRRDGSLVRTLTGHHDRVWGVAFSPNGQLLISGSWDNTINIWNIDGSLVETLAGHGDRVLGVTFSPDGQTIASASYDKTVRLWRRNKLLFRTLRRHRAVVVRVAISPDGRLVASGGDDKTIALWTTDGSFIQTLTGHSGEVYGIAFSPDGQTIASGSADKTIKLWQRDGELRRTLTGHKDEVWGVAFSPDGQMIASVSRDRTIKLWQRDGTLIKTLTGHQDRIVGVAFSPDSILIASASDDNTVKIWQRDGSLLTTFTEHQAGVNGIAFSPDSTLIASASDDNTLKLWTPEGNLITTFEGHSGPVWEVQFSANGQMILSGSWDGTLKLWKLDGTLLTTLTEHRRGVWGTDVSADDRIIASGSADNTVILWNLKQVLEKDTILRFSCDWVKDYLRTNAEVEESDRHLCE